MKILQFRKIINEQCNEHIICQNHLLVLLHEQGWFDWDLWKVTQMTSSFKGAQMNHKYEEVAISLPEK